MPLRRDRQHALTVQCKFRFADGHILEECVPAQIGDVNGDSIPDLLLPGDGSVGIALGRGNGTFLAPFVEGVGGGLGQVLMQNLHGQSPSAGRPDLVAPDSGGGVTVLINTTK
jgi:hypothetical protein